MRIRTLVGLIIAGAIVVFGAAYVSLDAIVDRSALRTELNVTKQKLGSALTDLETRTLTRKTTDGDDLAVIFGDANPKSTPSQIVLIQHTPSGDQETYLTEVVNYFGLDAAGTKKFLANVMARNDVQVVAEQCYTANSQPLAKIQWSAGYCTRTPVAKDAAKKKLTDSRLVG